MDENDQHFSTFTITNYRVSRKDRHYVSQLLQYEALTVLLNPGTAQDRK